MGEENLDIQQLISPSEQTIESTITDPLEMPNGNIIIERHEAAPPTTMPPPTPWSWDFGDENRSSVIGSVVSVDETTIGVVSSWEPSLHTPDSSNVISIYGNDSSAPIPYDSTGYMNPIIDSYYLSTAPPINSNITFHMVDSTTPVLQITQEGFFVKGEQVSEGRQIYDAFCEWLRSGKNFEKDPLKNPPLLFNRYDLLLKQNL
jgi:hypothetical protein